MRAGLASWVLVECRQPGSYRFVGRISTENALVSINGVALGLAADLRSSSDAPCLSVLCEVCERKSNIFRPLKLPPLNHPYI